VDELTDLAHARRRLLDAGALVGSSNHGVSLSLYAKDPDGLEFEIFWTVPGGGSPRTTDLDLQGELARRGLPRPGSVRREPEIARVVHPEETGSALDSCR